MRTVSLILLASVAVYLLAVPLASGQDEKTAKANRGNVEEQIKTIQAQLVQAQLKDDTSFFEKYFTDDYTAIYATGKLYTKVQDIETSKSGDLKYESIDVRDRKIRVYGNTAVVVTLVSAKGTRSGKPFSGDFRLTRVWVKQEGNWKSVAFQATRVAPASQ